MPEELHHDWRNLSGLIEATAQRQTIPCRNGRQPPPAWWTFDDITEQAAAAGACTACPVLAQCLAHGVKHPKEVGIYGGLTEKQRASAAREFAKETP
ncbi:WhiB family transcriptional regulator [Demequina lutea]|uniref:4Fe-4S Wbl-type domain-containing protein n=1 Tax=Demequina lutea TaxID=431489 RepID=A0A7Z0CKN9_9MICO|nr:WhiB family transcriptional regulator [Demequina lutea]NYI42047.1 hypothetical protein [Demequina lutea]